MKYWIVALHQDWSCSVVRAAMGIELWDGYKSRPKSDLKEWGILSRKLIRVK